MLTPRNCGVSFAFFTLTLGLLELKCLSIDILGCWAVVGWERSAVNPGLGADIAEMRSIMEGLQATHKVPLTRPSPLLTSQGPTEWREGEAQATGPTRHGAAA